MSDDDFMHEDDDGFGNDAMPDDDDGGFDNDGFDDAADDFDDNTFPDDTTGDLDQEQQTPEEELENMFAMAEGTLVVST